MKPRRRFIEDIKGMPTELLAQFFCKLDPLCLPSAERWGWLPETDIAQPGFLEDGKPSRYPGDVAEKGPCLIDGHVQDFCYILPLVPYIQRFPVIPLPMADFALDIDVGHEKHGNADLTVPLASLATAAPDVEAEAPGFITPQPGLGKGREQFPDRGEQLGIGSRV